MLLTSPCSYEKLYAVNVTALAITPPAPTTTEPATGMYYASPDSLSTDDKYNAAALCFFGEGPDNGTATATVIQWRRIGTLWVPTPLLDLNLTFGTSVGVAGSPVSNTERFADTIAESTVYTEAKEIISPAGNKVAVVKIDFFGGDAVQVLLAKGTMTSVNVGIAGF